MKNPKTQSVWFRRKIGNCLSVWLGLALVLVVALAVGTVFLGPLSAETRTKTTGTVEARASLKGGLTITSSADAHGSISPSGAVTVEYHANQAIVITPDVGYRVADVVVDGSSVGAVTRYTFKKVTANHTIAASFAPSTYTTYTITSSAGANGSISPSGTVTVVSGSDKAFSITPATGYHVADVIVDGSPVGAVSNYAFTGITTNHTISASFALTNGNTYTITASAGVNGSISPLGDVTVVDGSDRAFGITPATGCHVADVVVDGSSVGEVSSYTFTGVTSNHTIAASFAIDTYTITASAAANGSISPLGTVTVVYGDDKVYGITPATGYHVADVIVDGSSVGAVSSYTFTGVTSNHTIAVSFAIDTYAITASAGVNGLISPSGAVTLEHGSDQAFAITPDTGYHVADVIVDGSPVGAVSSYTFTGVTSNHIIAASFALNTNTTYNITASAGAHGSISPSGTVTVVSGSDKAFGITPASGYHVADVVVDGSSVGPVNSYTFTGITSNHTIDATFAHDPDTTVIAANDSPNPEDADSVCDGIDDQIQIQAAIDAFVGKPGIVRLLDGTFNISSSILVRANLTLEGEGDSTVIRLANSSNCDVITTYGGRSSTQSDITMREFKIDGNKGNQTNVDAGCGIYRRGSNCLYEYLTIENCLTRGISHSMWTTCGNNVKILNNIIRDCGYRGIYTSYVNNPEISYNQVYNCASAAPTPENVCIAAWYGEQPIISYNYIEGGGLVRQLEARDTIGGADIIGNTLVDGLGMGIAPHTQYARIINNTVINAGNNAIDTCTGTDAWIEGNYVSRVLKNPLGGYGENLGIALNSKRATAINNYIEFCGRAGIQLGPDCSDNQILNNVIKNCGQQETMGKAAIWLQIFTCDRPLLISNTVIRGNVCFDDQSVKTQRYGVMLTTESISVGYIDGVVIEDNDFRGNAVSGINPYDPAKVLNVQTANNLT